MPQVYYLPAWRSITIGVILLAVGVTSLIMMLDLHASLWYNIQRLFLNFGGVFDFLVSVIMLLFKIGFLAGGYFFIKYAKGVERAKLDDKGLYYREIPKGSNTSKIAMDAGPLTFIGYNHIKDIVIRKTFWMGKQLILTTDAGIIPLVALGVLKDDEKQEIVELIKAKIPLVNE